MSSNFHSRVGNPIPRGEKQKITVYFIKDSIVYWSGQFTGLFYYVCDFSAFFYRPRRESRYFSVQQKTTLSVVFENYGKWVLVFQESLYLHLKIVDSDDHRAFELKSFITANDS